MKRKRSQVKMAETATDAWELLRRMKNEQNPDLRDITHLRNLVRETPGMLRATIDSHEDVRLQLVKKISGNGHSQADLLARCDQLKAELGGADAPPLEQLMIDHIATLHLRLISAEIAYTQFTVNASCPFREGDFWDARLSRNQIRYIRAIEALARIRKLSRNTPALQVNIAAHGGQQLNVQGGPKR